MAWHERSLPVFIFMLVLVCACLCLESVIVNAMRSEMPLRLLVKVKVLSW